MRTELANAARHLLVELTEQPWGQVSPSVYETGRLVTLAPWLPGQRVRVAYLAGWCRSGTAVGAADGYGLVPTLSATEALLTTLRRGPAGTGTAALDGARHGLTNLFGWLGGGRPLPVPDTPAIEIIVPALVAAVNRHLDELADAPLPGLDPWRTTGRLPLPPGMDGGLVAAVRSAVAAGSRVPDKLLHSLEVLAPAVAGAAGVRPVPPGTVGASPAATAAWLGRSRGTPPGRRVPAGPAERSARYLRAVAERHGGPVPSVTPVGAFERAWVLSELTRAGFHVPVPAAIPAGLAAGLTARGTPGGAGLPPDADTTSVALLVLHHLGYPADLDCLWAYETPTHFCAWPGERTASPTVNAHVLDAYASRLATGRRSAPRYRATAAKLAGWLAEQQRADGAWTDKWHASPYYATVCCARALDRYGAGRPGASEGASVGASAAAIGRAVEFVLGTQRADGSWGRWCGTAEETAYALQVLLQTRPTAPHRQGRRRRATAAGYGYLAEVLAAPSDPPLWHDKDLYRPAAVVRASILAALYLSARDPVVAGSTDSLSAIPAPIPA